ncbi:MAG TPA: hypothetical protein VGJ81_19805 [Thermoanaerobaculia bacterium]|jgi:hypothetical protein
MATKARVVVPFPRGTKAREIEYVIEQYHKAHPDADPSEIPDLIAEWAYNKGLWKRPPVDPVVALSRDIARYLRNIYVTDPQGREVRKNHAVMIEVQTPSGPKRRSIWKELFHADAEHMKVSFQLRRRAAEQDVKQLHLDWSSYQDNNVFGAKLDQMDFDFNKDIEESNLPTTYPDADDDDGDDIF